MTIALYTYDNPPSPFIVRKTANGVPGGRFFLDFSRKLEVKRWFAIDNTLIGPAVCLRVPVIHEGERTGTRVVDVKSDDPYFHELRELWKTGYPTYPTGVSTNVDELKVMSDFVAQFPEDF